MADNNEPLFQKETPKEQVAELLSALSKDVLKLSEGDVINTARVFARIKDNLRQVRALTEAYMSARTKW